MPENKYDLFDFDKTVYPYDSETVFLFYCILHRPYLIILGPWLLLNLILFFLGFGDNFKGRCFSFLRFIDGEKMAKKFWEKQQKRIYPIFEPQNRERPVVVCSASPEFLLKPICEKYKVNTLIATRMNPKTGKIEGFNCKDKQKPLRIAEAVPDAEFVNVCSDSIKSDVHIFELGEKCFHAKKGVLTEMSIEEIRRKAKKE
ncbi:MAG: haloacid dehalogenase-like hydrolase [Clostridiaceae bacterium]|nr:haloacid dehalogenase-like hydrolase [Clostridiaceae bacterium]